MDIRSVAAAYGIKSVSSTSKVEKKVAPEKVAVARSEQVEISETSQNIQKIRDQISKTPDVRIKVVEEIKNKIKQNGYPLESTFYKALESMVNDRTLL